VLARFFRPESWVSTQTENFDSFNSKFQNFLGKKYELIDNFDFKFTKTTNLSKICKINEEFVKLDITSLVFDEEKKT